MFGFAAIGFSARPPSRPATRGRAVVMTMSSRDRLPSREELLVKNFLCQRAIQTQLYTAGALKNDHQKNWLLDFMKDMGCAPLHSGTRMYHSHLGLSVPWNELLSSILSAPDEHRVVTVVWGSGSPKRSQGAAATTMFADDAAAKAAWLAKQDVPRWGPKACAAAAGPVVASWYDAGTRLIAPASGPAAGSASSVNPYLPTPKPKTYHDTISPAKIGRQLLTIREQLACEFEEDFALLKLCNAELRRHHTEEVRHSVDNEEHLQYAISSRETDDNGNEASPLRLANFDLIKTAVTHGAVMRLQKELEAEPTEKHAAEWLKLFSRTHGGAFKGGPYAWRAGRDYVLTMMEQPVSMGTTLGGNARFLDPLGLAERLLDLREEVSMEWAGMMAAVPSEHEQLHVEQQRAKLEDIMSA